MKVVQDVERYISSLGRRFSRFPDSDSWLILLENAAGEFYLTVNLQEEGVTLVINPLIDRPGVDSLARLAFHLCRLNHDIYLFKCFVDDELDVGISVDLSEVDVTEQAFTAAYDAIVGFLEAEIEDLKRLVGNPQAPSRYLPS